MTKEELKVIETYCYELFCKRRETDFGSHDYYIYDYQIAVIDEIYKRLNVSWQDVNSCMG